MSDTAKTIALIKAIGGGSGGSSNSTGQVFMVGVDPTSNALQKTWKEIFDAMSSDMIVVLKIEPELIGVCYGFVSAVGTNDYQRGADPPRYFVDAITLSEGSITPLTFVTHSENGYPVLYHNLPE